MSKLIGLSVSFCIRDICEGTVKLEDVQWIIAGFSVRQTPEQIYANYKDIYWRKCPNALEVLRSVTIRYEVPEEKQAIRSLRPESHWTTLEAISERMTEVEIESY